MKSICRIDFIDNQNRTDRISKFVLIYQDINTRRCILRPLTSILEKEVAHALIEIFTTTGVPYMLKCNRDKIFACQIVCHLYHLGIHIIVAHESIQSTSKKNPTDDITKIISEMIDTWLMINDPNKWIEGLDIIQFQINHNIYYDAIHLPINFNNTYSLNGKQCVTELKRRTKSMFTVNIKAKTRKDFNDKVKIDLPIFSNPVEDNDKYEIIKEILDELEHQNPISNLKGIHNDEFPQLHQKAAKGCPNTEVLQKHNKCSISNTANEEVMPEKVKKVDQECSDSEVEHLNNNSTDSHTTDKEKFPEFLKEAVRECSNLEDIQGNKEPIESNITDKKESPHQLVQEAVQEYSNLENLALQEQDECT